MMDAKELGRRGEDAAADYLERKGYRVVERNYRLPIGEIDIVAERGSTLVFVEVKTRRGDAFGSPAQAVGFKKQQKIISCARWFLRQRHLDDRPCRFDVIEIYAGEGRAKIRHLAGAFELPS